MKLNLIILNETYAICRFKADSDFPDWISDSEFYSLTKTKDELSLVCQQNDSLSQAIEINKDWRIIKVSGPLDFSLTGIIAEISGILAENKIPVFTISTYQTDYFLVKGQDINKAIDSLKYSGYDIISEIK